ncbi:uncharacterized protein BKA78DRAFT_320162 [Phyllosticta capitalensis]|uniref:uncharacterized protein n=1 Tax=Phyllosticta capitalensis TaxID=121624 RepID=UPI00312E5F38
MASEKGGCPSLHSHEHCCSTKTSTHGFVQPTKSIERQTTGEFVGAFWSKDNNRGTAVPRVVAI